MLEEITKAVTNICTISEEMGNDLAKIIDGFIMDKYSKGIDLFASRLAPSTIVYREKRNVLDVEYNSHKIARIIFDPDKHQPEAVMFFFGENWSPGDNKITRWNGIAKYLNVLAPTYNEDNVLMVGNTPFYDGILQVIGE